MRKIFAAFAFLISAAAWGQSTTVSTTGVIDTDSNTWTAGTYLFTFVSTGLQPSAYSWNGGTMSGNTSFSGALNSSGAFSFSLPDNSQIFPSGTRWAVTICPNATSGCVSLAPQSITGATYNLTSALNAIAAGPRFAANPSAYGYGTVEVTPTPQPGAFFYNTSTGASPTCNQWSGSAWQSCATGGSGSGTVTSFSAGNVVPLYTCTVATPTTTPALTCTISNAAQNSVLAGPASGGAGAYSFQTAPTIAVTNMTGTGGFSITGNAGTATAIASTGANGTFWGVSGGVQGYFTPSGSGTVTSSGSPTTQIAKFSSATNIVPAAAADVVSLFSSCSGTQYLGADGACHSASGSGSVTSVTFTGDGVVDSSTPSTAVTSSGTVTATVLTQAAHTILGNHTGSTAAPTFATLTAADIPAGCQAITSSSGAATVNWASGPCAVVTANTGDTAVAVTFTNPVAGYPGGYFLGLINNATPNTWSFSPTPNQLKTPQYASEGAYNYYTYTGSAYNGTGSNATPTLIYGTERSTPPTSAAGAFVCHWNSTTHQMTCSDNGTNTGNMVTPLSSQAAHKWVSYIDNTGLQNSTQPAFTDISGSLASSQLPVGTVISQTPATGTSDTLQCSTGTSAQTFATTISRPAFTQTAGAIWELKATALVQSSASALTFVFSLLDNGTAVYTSGVQTNSQSGTFPTEATLDEEITGATLTSAALTVAPVGGVFSNFGATTYNHVAQTTGYNSNSAETLSLQMTCSAATAGNSVQLLGLVLTKIY